MYLLVNVCASHPNDSGCQEPDVFGEGKETRRQLGCCAANYPQNEQFVLTKMVFRCSEAFFDNNYFMRGYFVCICWFC